jgi:hypothetical protein
MVEKSVGENPLETAVQMSTFVYFYLLLYDFDVYFCLISAGHENC